MTEYQVDNAIVRVTGSTFQTGDYSLFKRLEGNRDVTASRAQKIIRSIKVNGYIFNPIVVNEKYEVIDGQGRLEALECLNLPVDFVISHGAGLKECISLNASGTLWNLEDYIESFCELNNENYIRLRALIKEFPELKTKVKVCCATGTAAMQAESLKRGNLIVTEQMERTARADLQFAMRFHDAFRRVKGDSSTYYYSVIFAAHAGADKERLISTIEKADLRPAPKIRIALDEVSDIYNKHLKQTEKRIYLYQSYKESLADKYGWYNAKWQNGATRS